MSAGQKPNYLLILLLAFISAGAMWAGNRWIYTPNMISVVDQMAPTVERLALLAQAPTAQPTRGDVVAQNYTTPTSVRPSRWQIGMPDGSKMLADEETETLVWQDSIYSCNDRGNWAGLHFTIAAVLEQVCSDMWEFKGR